MIAERIICLHGWMICWLIMVRLLLVFGLENNVDTSIFNTWPSVVGVGNSWNLPPGPANNAFSASRILFFYQEQSSIARMAAKFQIRRLHQKIWRESRAAQKDKSVYHYTDDCNVQHINNILHQVRPSENHRRYCRPDRFHCRHVLRPYTKRMK